MRVVEPCEYDGGQSAGDVTVPDFDDGGDQWLRRLLEGSVFKQANSET
jgi:hypothetical protein